MTRDFKEEFSCQEALLYIKTFFLENPTKDIRYDLSFLEF